MNSQDERLESARLSLEGLSVGDAFGDQYFLHAEITRAKLTNRELPDPPWGYSDDTNMALSIYENLRLHGEIDRDELARSFVRHYDPGRGYGAAMHRLFRQIDSGVHWSEAAGNLFDGQGSYGNGAAMRIAPLGAYFADDLKKVVEEARKSAAITHAHEEAVAGAIAVAVAAGIAAQLHGKSAPTRPEFLEKILPYVPESEVKSGINRAIALRSKERDHVVGVLGNGYHISAQDTVPITLWVAGEHLSSFEEAMWTTASALGDIDTNCAIVGGIVSGYVGAEAIPQEWISKREPLPEWALG